MPRKARFVPAAARRYLDAFEEFVEACRRGDGIGAAEARRRMRDRAGAIDPKSGARPRYRRAKH